MRIFRYTMGKLSWLIKVLFAADFQITTIANEAIKTASR